MLPLRVVGWGLGCVLSSQWISEDVLGVDSPQGFSLVSRPCAGLYGLSSFLRSSGSCTDNYLSANVNPITRPGLKVDNILPVSLPMRGLSTV